MADERTATGPSPRVARAVRIAVTMSVGTVAASKAARIREDARSSESGSVGWTVRSAVATTSSQAVRGDDGVVRGGRGDEARRYGEAARTRAVRGSPPCHRRGPARASEQGVRHRRRRCTQASPHHSPCAARRTLTAPDCRGRATRVPSERWATWHNTPTASRPAQARTGRRSRHHRRRRRARTWARSSSSSRWRSCCCRGGQVVPLWCVHARPRSSTTRAPTSEATCAGATRSPTRSSPSRSRWAGASTATAAGGVAYDHDQRDHRQQGAAEAGVRPDGAVRRDDREDGPVHEAAQHRVGEPDANTYTVTSGIFDGPVRASSTAPTSTWINGTVTAAGERWTRSRPGSPRCSRRGPGRRAVGTNGGARHVGPDNARQWTAQRGARERT